MKDPTLEVQKPLPLFASTIKAAVGCNTSFIKCEHANKK
jgi:hypothetical protein